MCDQGSRLGNEAAARGRTPALRYRLGRDIRRGSPRHPCSLVGALRRVRTLIALGMPGSSTSCAQAIEQALLVDAERASAGFRAQPRTRLPLGLPRGMPRTAAQRKVGCSIPAASAVRNVGRNVVRKVWRRHEQSHSSVSSAFGRVAFAARLLPRWCWPVPPGRRLVHDAKCNSRDTVGHALLDLPIHAQQAHTRDGDRVCAGPRTCVGTKQGRGMEAAGRRGQDPIRERSAAQPGQMRP